MKRPIYKLFSSKQRFLIFKNKSTNCELKFYVCKTLSVHNNKRFIKSIRFWVSNKLIIFYQFLEEKSGQSLDTTQISHHLKLLRIT